MTEGFEDYLRERRERSERTRHLLVGVLALTCIALAVSNVFLALRLTAGRGRPDAEPPARAASTTEAPARPSSVTEAPSRPATVTGAPARAAAPQAAAPSASIRSDSDGPAPAVTLPKMSGAARPEPAEQATPSAPAEPAARADAPPAAVDRPSDAIDLPSRSSVASLSAPRAAPPRAMTMTTPPPTALAAPTPAAPEEVTAAWMLTTYGRGAAEARAKAALEFYNAQSVEGRYWRRVLALITAAR